MKGTAMSRNLLGLVVSFLTSMMLAVTWQEGSLTSQKVDSAEEQQKEAPQRIPRLSEGKPRLSRAGEGEAPQIIYGKIIWKIDGNLFLREADGKMTKIGLGGLQFQNLTEGQVVKIEVAENKEASSISFTTLSDKIQGRVETSGEGEVTIDNGFGQLNLGTSCPLEGIVGGKAVNLYFEKIGVDGMGEELKVIVFWDFIPKDDENEK